MKKQQEIDTVTAEHKIDLHWNDSHVFPSIIYPDLAFLCEKMTSETLNAAYVPGGLFLDVGCGRAVDAIQLLERGMRGVGVEVSDFMLEEAKKTLGEKGLKMELVRAFGENMPFADNTFDVVYCKGAIDHFYNPQAAIREMARVTKPDGWVVISAANFDSTGFRLGRYITELRRSKSEEMMVWDTPVDHTIRIDYRVLKVLVRPSLQQEKIWGTSLLFGVPRYGGLLNRLPRPLTNLILNSFNLFARYFPSCADVLLLRGHPRRPLPDLPL
ncbi:MAG TPA: class I SAM-dependent methyltransferase [Candidatus Limnocylindrales bacterium]|nr:class I SAM-dependent methyltransferase [Candidatus Limnocylindrales bacterium]